MIIREVGFRPLYHYVCAFELNDKLRNIIRECPGADKASHAVVYGYIDPEDGMMLEVLSAGKQAPKYFYFRDPYQGARITLRASEVEDVEFMYFPDLENRFYKKFVPRIEELKQYDAPDSLEETRKLVFLDECRSNQYPDDVEVLLLKDGLKKEKVWVHMTGLGDHCINGVLLNEPYQKFGISKGDSISFNVREKDGVQKRIECYLDLNEPSGDSITAEDLKDGTYLKGLLAELRTKDDDELFIFILAVSRSSRFWVPCRSELDNKAKKILMSRGPDEDFTDEEMDIIAAGTKFIPEELTADSKAFFPIFTTQEEIQDKISYTDALQMPLTHVIDMALARGKHFEGIVINPFTDDFVIDKELFKTIKGIDPIFEVDDNVVVEAHPEAEVERAVSLEGQNGVFIRVGKMDFFNYALYHNDIEPIRGIQIQNTTGTPIENIILRITSDNSIFKPFEALIHTLPSGAPVTIDDPHIFVNGSELASLTETINVGFCIEIVVDNKVISTINRKMKILAYDQWHGSLSYRDLLPAFVLPNSPVIADLMKEVSANLKANGKTESLEGYQRGDVDRIDDFARASYEVIKSKNITYANPPASFMIAGQRIRTPDSIMEQKLGTCMDMSLLYAALLEAIGLHTILVLFQGHIFTGYWTRERTVEEIKAGQLIVDDPTVLAKYFTGGANDIALVECTCMCSDKDSTFDEARIIGESELVQDSEQFDCSIDVCIARLINIRPIPSRVKNDKGFVIDTNSTVDGNPSVIGTSLMVDSELKTHKITNKRELWESKLLDLSNRNILLNLSKTSAILPIMSSCIDKLEDAFSDGEEFGINPIPLWIQDIKAVVTDKNGKEKAEQWLSLVTKQYGLLEITEWPTVDNDNIGDKVRQEYRKHRLYSFYDDKQLERNLTTIYRAARKSQQENGVSSLYVAIGVLRWFDDKHDQPFYAPLILVPVELVRKSANQGYALHMRNDDPYFNSTLLEMLHQRYNIDLSVLERLPSDEHGIDVKKVFNIVRSAVFSISGWNVVETCVLGNFSFAQFAMWNDIHSLGDELENNKLVRSLIKGHVDWDTTESIDDNKRVYLPISVDDTQLKAIKMSAQGNTFVLHGPPGTGKSQTITAMIANLMAEGKKVLFVAEKEAALKVVKDRLERMGLGDFCLEVHSEKADKKHVLSELEAALNNPQMIFGSNFEYYEEKTAESRKKLDLYADHLHEVHTCGYSLRMLIAQYELVRDEREFVRFDQDEVGILTNSDLIAHIPLIEQLVASRAAIEDVDESVLADVKLASFSADVRSKVKRLAEVYRISLDRSQSIGNRVAEIMGTEKPCSLSDLYALDSLISLYNDKKGTNTVLIDLLNEDTDELVNYLKNLDRVQEEELMMQKCWHPEFIDMDMNQFITKFDAASKKLFGKSSALSAVTAEVQSFSYVTLSYPQIPALLNNVVNFQAKKKKLEQDYNHLSEKTKSLLEEIPSIDSYNRAIEVATDCQEQAERFPGGLSAIMDISHNAENSKFFSELEECIDALKNDRNEFNELLVRQTEDNSDSWFDDEKALCNYLIENASVLKDWGFYNNIRKECFKVGLGPVVTALENGMNPETVIGAYKKGLYYALINHIIKNDDVLSCFSGASFNEAIVQFKKMDDDLMLRTKEEIIRQLHLKIPNPSESPTIGREINILRKAISSNGRGVSLRELFSKTSDVLYSICPCMLMSPNDVAQYLPQENGLFDVVIFDEASQLPTCKAIGALLRAKDAVIVGDPKQMPPTSFFAGAGPEVEDFTIADLDSILDDVLALGVPSQHLQWHYRSKHESLIAFSNTMFYKNRMYTFPSSNDRERHVNERFVDGSYKKGTNVKEAEEVVAEIVRRYKDPDLINQTVGVVTFNMKQQELIENLLAKQYQQDPEFDYWANNGAFPLFVKNLENVQGDERDAIIFSICYGPDEKGKVSNNFGPINKAGGEKRLNVAFSRSKVSMTVITSMHSSDIRVDEDSPEGVIAFQRFLSYAEGHDIVTESTERVNASYAKAGILQRIYKELKLNGYECTTMLGHSDFHIDIAVVDPFDKDRYMLGILLDGDGYRQTKNTRDREVSQVFVLKSLGWKLCRVWSMDWWDNRDREIDKLLRILGKLKAESEENYLAKKEEEENRKAEEARREQEIKNLKSELESQAEQVLRETEEDEQERLNQPEIHAERDASVATAPSAEKDEAGVIEKTEDPSVGETNYIVVDYQKIPDTDESISIDVFSAPGFKKQVAERIHFIVKTEAPILKETLMRRVFESYGISKSSNSAEAFEKAFMFAKVKSVKLKGTIFCWRDDQDPRTYNVIRVSNDRTCDEICLKEISNAICYVLSKEGPMLTNDLIKKTSMLFGYKRLGKNVEMALMNGLKWARSNGDIEINKDVASLVRN